MALTKVIGAGAEGLTLSSTSLTVANGLTLTDGNVTLASGHGIDFAANSSASGMSSELFDDYEEGTWTPTFNNFTIGNATLTGVYTKIGDVVTAKMQLILGSTSSITGNFNVTGLPFTNGATVTSTYQAAGLDSGSYWINLVARFISNSTTIDIMYPSQVPYNTLLTVTPTTPFTWTTSDRVEFIITYITT